MERPINVLTHVEGWHIDLIEEIHDGQYLLSVETVQISAAKKLYLQFCNLYNSQMTFNASELESAIDSPSIQEELTYVKQRLRDAM